MGRRQLSSRQEPEAHGNLGAVKELAGRANHAVPPEIRPRSGRRADLPSAAFWLELMLPVASTKPAMPRGAMVGG